MIFLNMLYRVRLSSHMIFWIKRHVQYQVKYCDKYIHDNTFQCSPAHVMLYHSILSRTNDTDAETKQVQARHKQVIKDVQEGKIPAKLCVLLQEMTNIVPE